MYLGSCRVEEAHGVGGEVVKQSRVQWREQRRVRTIEAGSIVAAREGDSRSKFMFEYSDNYNPLSLLEYLSWTATLLL